MSVSASPLSSSSKKISSQSTGFHSIDISLKVALAPANIANPLDTVKLQLNDLLFKYNDDLKGIPLSYSDLKFPVGKKHGRIIAEHPWIHLDVLVKIVIFQPYIGQKLSGKITQVSDSHISILVYGMFNANISCFSLKKHYKYNYSTKAW